MKRTSIVVFICVTTFLGNILPVHAKGTDKNIEIIYLNESIIEGADYLISVPLSLQFTKAHKRVDTTVSLFNKDGLDYEGENKVIVNVISQNNYRLKNAEEFQEVKYTLLKYAKNSQASSVTNSKNEIGVLDKQTATIKGEAILGPTSVTDNVIGEFEDVLTYQISQ